MHSDFSLNTNTPKNKIDEEKGNRNNKIPRSEKDKRGAFDREREFGIVPAASHIKLTLGIRTIVI